MTPEEIKHTGAGKIFENRVLEKLTRTHALIPVSIFYIVAVVLLVMDINNKWTSPVNMAAYFASGILFWTLFEYLAHRFIFHMDTTSKLKKKVQYTFHGVHHEYPRDKQRLAMPPVLSVVLSGVLIAVFRLVFNEPGFAFAAGFLSGYASYLLIHFSIHSRIPPTNFLGKLWMHHSIHHYKDDGAAFGVSSPLWDIVFGTIPENMPGTKKYYRS